MVEDQILNKDVLFLALSKRTNTCTTASTFMVRSEIAFETFIARGSLAAWSEHSIMDKLVTKRTHKRGRNLSIFLLFNFLVI